MKHFIYQMYLVKKTRYLKSSSFKYISVHLNVSFLLKEKEAERAAKAAEAAAKKSAVGRLEVSILNAEFLNSFVIFYKDFIDLSNCMLRSFKTNHVIFF